MRIRFFKGIATAVTLLLCAACSGATKDRAAGAPDQQEQPAAASIQPPPPDAVLSKPASMDSVMTAAQAARASFAADGASSVDALIDQFVEALTRKDKNALTKLRVTKTEYTDLIIPGTVPVGQPPRLVSEQPKEYYWNLLDTKSHYYTDNLVGLYGGRSYFRHDLKFSRPTKEYAWYTALGQVRLELAANDATYHLLTGWLAEVDGKYKFISYEYND